MPMLDPTALVTVDSVFSAVEARYGGHPNFGAAAQPIRDAIAHVLANPASLGWVLSALAFLFPGEATLLNGIKAALSLLPANAAPADPNAAVVIQGHTPGQLP